MSHSLRWKPKVSGSDCRQKAILPPEGGRIALSANERIAEFLDFTIQVKFAYVNKLRARNARPYNVAEKSNRALYRYTRRGAHCAPAFYEKFAFAQ